jgi:alpha-L-fucosidase
VCGAGFPEAVFDCTVGREGFRATQGAVAAMTYTPTWSSVDRHLAAPEWFQDAKFGIYHHWGVFSVPAFNNEWYLKRRFSGPIPVLR